MCEVYISEGTNTLNLVLNSGKRAKTRTARDTTTKAWREDGRREARQTEEKMEAFRDMELDTLREGGEEEEESGVGCGTVI